MKKTGEKSIFAKFKPYWDQGKNLLGLQLKIGFCIQNFAVNSIFTFFKQNSSVLNEIEKKEFESMIRELAAEKKNLDSQCTVEEFINFLQNMFANVDDEDRHGEVTMKTSASFKLIGELIDVLSQWGEIPEEFQKKSNNLFKCREVL